MNVDAAGGGLYALSYQAETKVKVRVHCAGIEADPIIGDRQLKATPNVSHLNPDLGGPRMLRGIAHCLSGKLVAEQFCGITP